MGTTSGRQEFTIRGLLALARQINDDPSLVESDWRAPFLEAFELTESQRRFLDDDPAGNNQKVQGLFRIAASQARKGHRMKLRIVGDVTNDSRRILQIEIPTTDRVELADRTIIEETTMLPEGSLTWPIVCCCADCCCWHWCDPSVNPCA